MLLSSNAGDAEDMYWDIVIHWSANNEATVPCHCGQVQFCCKAHNWAGKSQSEEKVLRRLNKLAHKTALWHTGLYLPQSCNQTIQNTPDFIYQFHSVSVKTIMIETYSSVALGGCIT